MLRARLFPPVVFLAAVACLCLCHPRTAPVQTGSLRRITSTSEESLNLNPSISGDGRRIAFETTANLVGAGPHKGFQAINADLAGEPPSFALVGQTRAVAPAVSEDGSRLAFASTDNPTGANPDGNSEIFFYDGDHLRQITDTYPGDLSQRLRNGNFRPSISDDGRFIAFTSNRDLTNLNADANLEVFIYDTLAQTFKQFTDQTGTTGASDVKISGDGSRLVYLSINTPQDEGQPDLLIYDRLSETERVIASAVRGLALTPGRALSKDGTRLVYSAIDEENANQVFLYDASKNLRRQISRAGAVSEDVSPNPSISGDGKRVSFATRRNLSGGNTDRSVELYLYDAPTDRLTRLTDAPAAANAEIISSLNEDGSLVAFNFPRVLSGPVSSKEFNNNSEIYLAQVAPRPSFSSELHLLNAASLGHEPSQLKAIAPGSIAIAGGEALAYASAQAARQPDGLWPQNLLGTSLTVNGHAAQLFYVSPTQVHFLLPAETETGPAEVIVTNSEGFQTRGTIEILRAAPGLFTLSADGRGPALVLDADTLAAGPFDPSNGQRRLILFATGCRFASQLSVNINGREALVESVRASTDLPGLDEIHVLVNRDLRGVGAVDLALRADERASNPVIVTFSGAARHDLIINEVLADPPEDIAGDANRDGTRSASQDEFVELVNSTDMDVDLGGYQLVTRSNNAASLTRRHLFAEGTIFPAGTSIVIFGGANIQTFKTDDAAFGGANILLASTGSLSLSNSGGIVALLEPDQSLVSQLSYGGSSLLKAEMDQSLTRSPDVSGQFAPHKSAAGSEGRAFSPGTHLDGRPFHPSPAISRIELTGASGQLIIGARLQLNARAFDSNGLELSGVIFRWQTSNPSIAAVDQNGVAFGIAEGTAHIKALARGMESAPLLLDVRPRERILTRIEVAPSSATVYLGGTHQFNARAFDQDDKELAGIAFDWSSSDASVATVNEQGLCTTLKAGSAIIRASAKNIESSATLNIIAPAVIINEFLADPADGAAGDANRDGQRSGTQDEFVEIANSSSATVDLSGWTIRTRPLDGTSEIIRHTFATGTLLPANDALVIFGGGQFDPDHPAFGGASVNPASSGGLALSNNGLTIILRDASGNFLNAISYGISGDNFGGDAVNQSITRSPDISGSYTHHKAAIGAGTRLFSPGTKLDGSFFAPRAGKLMAVHLTPLLSNIFVDQTATLTAQALDQFGRPLPGVQFTFASDNTLVASVETVNANAALGSATATLRGRVVGTAKITAAATTGDATATSEAAQLKVEPVPQRVTRVEVSPLSLTINRGGTQQFKAAAFDQHNQLMTGVVFNWSSDNTSVCVIDSNGLARGTGKGTTVIRAAAVAGSGGTVNGAAQLIVQVPLVINELLADVPPDNLSTANIIEGDANRDGIRSADDDEFIELFNPSDAAVDLSGLRLYDSGTATPRFTFPANTSLAPGRAAVIFGGGLPPAGETAFGGALLLTVANSSTQTSTLSLNDAGDTVTLRLSDGNAELILASLTYGSGGPIAAPSDQSLTRSPDAEVNHLVADFGPHASSINSAGRIFSPGTRSDGTPFGSPFITRLEILPQSASLNPGQTQLFTARAFAQNGDAEIEVRNVSFIWETSEASRAVIAPATGNHTQASAIAAGDATIRASAGGQQAAAALKVNPPPPVLNSVTISPASATVNVGQTTQFTSRPLDQYGHLMPGVSISFASGETTIASIESVSSDADTGITMALVRGLHTGSAQITATATNSAQTVMSAPATLTVTPVLPAISRIDVAPSSALIGIGASRQFTARAFDQHEQEMAGVSFNWTSSAAGVATINSTGLATGIGPGQTEIRASSGGVSSAAATLVVARKPAPHELIINEILAAPASDANRDGTGGDQRDEFVELINLAAVPIDLSGLNLYDNSTATTTTLRHTFPTGTILQPGRAILVFGGETGNRTNSNIPGMLGGDSRSSTATNAEFGGAIVQVASSYNLLNTGTSTSTSSGLSLNNSGSPFADCMRLVDGTMTGASPGIINGTLIAQSCFSTATTDKSFSRADQETGANRDFTGVDLHPQVNHPASLYNGRFYSPGLKRDGTGAFP
ncbi:MAG TPA: lamin tail domain-containing protein [Pyrinomonadaceae bacterium]|jgi:uncharacterized protein (TIGR03437 family)